MDLRCKMIDLECQLDILLKEQQSSTRIEIKDLFQKSRLSKLGGTEQYNLELVKMMLEMIATGAAPSTIEFLMCVSTGVARCMG